MNTRTLPGLLAATFMTSAYAPAAFAQADTIAPSEIIVTARRTEERLQDVPISITVFNQEELQKRNVTDGQDLARYTPSLSVRNGFGSNNTSFSIRGFAQEVRTTPSVGVYFADVVAARGPANIIAGEGAGPGNFFDLQNVQVLKGPQGTLFGRNTTGGAVLIVPKKPTSRLEGYVEGSYGNYDMRRLQAALNVPLSETFRIRVAMDSQKRDGYVRNISTVGPDRFNATDYTAVRASIVGDLASDLENYTIFSYVNSSTAGDLSKLFVCNPSPAPTNFLGQLACGQLAAPGAEDFYAAQNDISNPISKNEQWQVINTTTWSANDSLTIKNIISYSELKNKYRSDLFGSNFFLAPGLPISFTDILEVPGYKNADQSTMTEELQFRGVSPDGRINWQAGGYYETSKPLGTVGSLVTSLLTCTDALRFQCTDYVGLGAGAPVGSISQIFGQTIYSNFGIYAQGTYSLTDQLKFTAGLRYSNDLSKVWTSRRTMQFPAPNTPSAFCTDTRARQAGVVPTRVEDCRRDYRQRSDAPTWLVDLDYAPSRDLLLYAKYARGYRQGTADGRGAEGFDTFEPESVDSYEVGMKATLRGAVSGTLNLAAFYNDFTKQQLQVVFYGTGVPAQASIINAGKSRIYGLEAEGALTFFDSLTINASYAYLNTKLQSIEQPVLDPNSVYDTVILSSVAGDPLPLTPKHKLSVSATYTLPLPENVGVVSLGAIYSYASSQLVSRGSPFATIQPTNLVNLNFDWNSIAGTSIDLALFVNNATNKRYFSYISGYYNAAGLDTGFLSAPRMYGVRLRYRFGH